MPKLTLLKDCNWSQVLNPGSLSLGLMFSSTLLPDSHLKLSFPLIPRTKLAHGSHHPFMKQIPNHWFHFVYLSIKRYNYTSYYFSALYSNWSHIHLPIIIYISLTSKSRHHPHMYLQLQDKIPVFLCICFISYWPVKLRISKSELISPPSLFLGFLTSFMGY